MKSLLYSKHTNIPNTEPSGMYWILLKYIYIYSERQRGKERGDRQIEKDVCVAKFFLTLFFPVWKKTTYFHDFVRISHNVYEVITSLINNGNQSENLESLRNANKFYKDNRNEIWESFFHFSFPETLFDDSLPSGPLRRSHPMTTCTSFEFRTDWKNLGKGG